MKIPQLIIELGKAKEALGDIEVMMRIYRVDPAIWYRRTCLT